MGQLPPHISDMFDAQAKAQVVLAGIIAAAGGQWDRRTTLAKAFWWAHVRSLETRGAELSDYRIVHLPNGPAPNDLEALLSALISRGLLRESVDSAGPYNQHSYTVTEDGKEFVEQRLNEGEIACVNEAASKFKGMTATQASNWSHHHSDEWKRTHNGQRMNIGRDVIDSKAFDSGCLARKKEEGEIRKLFEQDC